MSGGKEQRQQLRVPVSDDVLGLLDTSVSRAEVEVADLSLGGAGLVVEKTSTLERRDRLTLGIHSSGNVLGESLVDLVHVREQTSARVVGVRFCAQGEGFLRRLCRFLVQRQLAEEVSFLSQGNSLERVSDTARITRLLQHCCRRRASLSVIDVSGRRLGSLIPSALREGRLAGRVEIVGGRLRVAAPCFLVFRSFTAIYIFPTTLVGSGDQQHAFSVPDQMLQGGARKLGRFTVGSDAPIFLEFLHPQVPGKMVRKRVKEAGPGGVSFALDVPADLLAMGSLIDTAVLRLPDGRSLACRGIVRHIHRDVSGRVTCGMELLGFSGNGQHVWVKNVLECLNPEVVEATPMDLEEVWDVLDRSGYLAEKPDSQIREMKAPFVHTWSRVLGAKEGGKCWIFRDQKSAVGTISTSKIYSKTWLIHHLGADMDSYRGKGHKLIVLSELASRTVLQWLETLHPDDYVLTYFDANKKFNKWTWFDFFDKHNGKGNLVAARLRVWDISLDGESTLDDAAGIEIREATQPEMRTIAADMLRRDGAMVADAFDYDPEMLTLGRMSSQGSDGKALKRERHLVVACREGEMQGYAVLETGAIGVNVFSLYDTCRVVLLGCADQEQNHDRNERAALRNALFAHAKRFYRSRERLSFLFIAGLGDEAPEGNGGFEAEAVRAVVSGRFLTRWAEDLDDIWIHRVVS